STSRLPMDAPRGVDEARHGTTTALVVVDEYICGGCPYASEARVGTTSDADSAHPLAAVDVDGGTCDVASLVAAQMHDGSGEVAGISWAAVTAGLHGQDPVAQVGLECFPHWALMRARRNGVDGDPVGGVVTREETGEGQQAPFGDGVGGTRKR